MPPNEALDRALLAAHAAGARDELISLYTEAADQAKSDQMAGFYLTHAYVFALEAGDARATEIHARLKSAGKEE